MKEILMKSVLLILSFAFMISVKAQYIKPTEVPHKIKATLDSIFPNNKYPAWKSTSDINEHILNYEATFTLEKKRAWVKIDSSGYLIQIEKEIDKNSLPPLSIEYITKNYNFKFVITS